MEQILKKYGNIIKGYDVETDVDGKTFYYVWLKKPYVVDGWQYNWPYDAITGATKKECLDLLKRVYKDEVVWEHLDDESWLCDYAKKRGKNRTLL